MIYSAIYKQKNEFESEKFMDFDKLLVMDGACGTNLQNMGVPADVWQGREGCNEWLNLAYPQVITDLHKAFIEAGSQVVETNTFGANRLVMAEYGLEEQINELNFAAVENARKAVYETGKQVYIVGSVGPGTKLPTLGQVEPDDLMFALCEQMRALIVAGVDGIILETSQDLLQVKLATRAAFQVMRYTKHVPLMVSVTMESSGTMLLGSDIAAIAAVIEPLPVASLGLNCATGPAEMESHIRYLAENWQRPISCMPNQGLPEIVDGKTVYNLKPEEFAQKMLHFVETYGVRVVGGCCGTTPGHIKAMTDTLKQKGLL